MKRFEVIVGETSLLTYTIDADSAQDAERIWRETDDQGERGEPQEDLEGHELVSVVEVL